MTVHERRSDLTLRYICETMYKENFDFFQSFEDFRMALQRSFITLSVDQSYHFQNPNQISHAENKDTQISCSLLCDSDTNSYRS